MEKPTKAERHEIYKGAIKQLRKHKDIYGLCAALSWWDGNDSFSPKYDAFVHMDKLFPEIAIYKPKRYCDFWFPRDEDGFKKRIAILKQAIKETEVI